MSDTIMSLTLSVIAVFVGTQALLWRAIVVLQRETARSFGAFRDEIKSARNEIKSEFANRLGATESRLLDAIDRLAA